MPVLQYIPVFALFLGLPCVLLYVSLKAQWALFRSASTVCFTLWCVGLAWLTLTDAQCNGNFLYGYEACLGVSRTTVNAITRYAFLACLAALCLYLLACLALVVRHLRAQP